ncbi:lytic transglycosylase domain-containing protein [Kitasatospora sp. NBC_01287]|uniref:aggregation-promoting factor C-terminal-like domain-containing protein n=1 Tax=Kitasatospora sp. NBC_01287 TaxID=2903573 RepID=UPI00224D797C|nr:transglycosylase SLT domain-containing protein [Kitasatospora sp. NBC_01287]MCX4745448.1 lytic transglycosylase domain-containing protein [Kitasatospora sp. NBC_01287]
MRNALMTTVRRRSSVVLASAGLAATVAASAVAFALPSDAATTAAPAQAGHATGAPAGAHGDVLAFSAAKPATVSIEDASHVTPNTAQGGGHAAAFAPFGTGVGAKAQAEPAPQPQQAPQQAPVPAPAPAPAEQPQPAPAPAPQPQPAPPKPAAPVATDTSPSGIRALAQSMVPAGQWASFANIVNHESSWNFKATNPSSGSYGLGQALPASKMASAGSDWRTNPVTQIKWTLNYMNERYGSPNAAWSFWQTHHWY